MESLQAFIISVLLWFFSAFLALSPQEQQLSWNGLHTEPLRHCQLPPEEVAGSDHLPRTFSVAVWNVYKWKREGSYARLSELSARGDLLLLQEVVGTERLSSELNEFSWHLNQAFRKDGMAVGVMTASRVAPTRLCGERIMEPWFGLPKTLLMTEYQVQQREFPVLVINLHGVNFTLDMDVYREQLDQIRLAASQHTGPILLAGDFNSWSASRQQSIHALASKLDLQPVEFTNDIRSSVFGYALDGIWVRGLTTVEAEVLSTPSSDHNALFATFRVKEGDNGYVNNPLFN